MNALYTAGTRQLSSINKDLEELEDYLKGNDGEASSLGASMGGSGYGAGRFGGQGIDRNWAAMQGQILTTLNAFSRVIDDYDAMARKEPKQEKRDKALIRVNKFKEEHSALRKRYEEAKKQFSEGQRSDLMSSATTSAYAGSSSAQTRHRGANVPESPFPDADLFKPNHAAEDFALREHSFIQETEASLDSYIAQGRAVLENLVEQKHILRGTKKRLVGAAETLGLSRDVIGWVERRSTQDIYIFFGGAAFTLFMFWVIYHYLG